MTNLLIAWKFNQEWLQNLCLHPKFLKMTLKSNSYLTSVSRRGSENPATLTFCKINPTKAVVNFLVA